MPRRSKQLNVAQIRALNKPGKHAVGDNLYVQVIGSGKSWLFRYMRNGKAREMGLGPIALVSLAEARQRAFEQRKLLHDGVDPLEARHAQSSSERTICFTDAACEYIETRRASWKNANDT